MSNVRNEINRHREEIEFLKKVGDVDFCKLIGAPYVTKYIYTTCPSVHRLSIEWLGYMNIIVMDIPKHMAMFKINHNAIILSDERLDVFKCRHQGAEKRFFDKYGKIIETLSPDSPSNK